MRLDANIAIMVVVQCTGGFHLDMHILCNFYVFNSIRSREPKQSGGSKDQDAAGVLQGQGVIAS